MGSVISFCHKGHGYSATAYYSLEKESFFIFIVFKEPYLQPLFGTDVTIKTDGRKVLPSKNHYPELKKLLDVLFEDIKKTPQFTEAFASRVKR